MFEKAINNFKEGYNRGVSWAKKQLNVVPMFSDESAQAAPLAMMTAVLGAMIMLGIIIIVGVLMPGIAGDIITALNISENNSFYTLITQIPAKATSSYNLLWVAVLVSAVVIIIGGIAGLAFLFMRSRA
jgi:hypothetical protein